MAELADQSETEGVLLRVDLVGLCGSDLNSFRGRNPLEVTYPRVLGHEVAGTLVSGGKAIEAGTQVTLSPLASSCGECVACRTGRVLTPAGAIRRWAYSATAHCANFFVCQRRNSSRGIFR